jgi:hypothetical protein
MILINQFVLVIVLIIIFYFLIRFLTKVLSRPERIFLSDRIKAKADWKFKKLLTKFKHEHKRKPTRDELFRLIINASHITIRRKGQKGHWGRQKVRKYLLEKHDIVNNYIMR